VWQPVGTNVDQHLHHHAHQNKHRDPAARIQPASTGDRTVDQGEGSRERVHGPSIADTTEHK
jgi:hypothetical protein